MLYIIAYSTTKLYESWKNLKEAVTQFPKIVKYYHYLFLIFLEQVRQRNDQFLFTTFLPLGQVSTLIPTSESTSRVLLFDMLHGYIRKKMYTSFFKYGDSP